MEKSSELRGLSYLITTQFALANVFGEFSSFLTNSALQQWYTEVWCSRYGIGEEASVCICRKIFLSMDSRDPHGHYKSQRECLATLNPSRSPKAVPHPLRVRHDTIDRTDLVSFC